MPVGEVDHRLRGQGGELAARATSVGDRGRLVTGVRLDRSIGADVRRADRRLAVDQAAGRSAGRARPGRRTGSGRWPTGRGRGRRRRPAGRRGARRGRRTSRRGGGVEGVEGAQAEPRRAVVDGGVHAAPRVERGDRGVAAERRGPTPGVGQVGERVGASARSTPSRSTYMPASPPQAASKAGWTLATIPSRASARCRRRRPSPRAPAGAGRPGRRAARARRRRPTASSTWRTAASPMQWKPAWHAARCSATWWTSDAVVEAQGAGGVRPVGVGLASARRCASRTRRRRTGPPGAGQRRARGPTSSPPALGQLAPVAEHLAGRAPAARSSRPARSSALETSGPAISCRLPMPSAAAARGWPAGRPPLARLMAP